jgi:hypothetical protein
MDDAMTASAAGGASEQGFRVRVLWQEETGRWIAEGPDADRPLADAATMQELIEKLKSAIHERFGGGDAASEGPSLSFNLMAEEGD